MNILSVAYPFAPVRPETAGGAEQILSTLDRELVDSGHRSIIIAAEDSTPAGHLVPVRVPQGEIDDNLRRNVHHEYRLAIAESLTEHHIDIIHMHGIDFSSYLPPPGPPVLVTLHLPVDWYPAQALYPQRTGTFFNCVSRSQQQRCPSNVRLLPYVENGVEHMPLKSGIPRLPFALSLGRICPEKGIHRAIEAARNAQISLVIAGQVFNYPEHLRYFRQSIVPSLDGRSITFVGPVDQVRKTGLLTSARCLLVTSTVPETSSLVTMEALACGTPVVAFAVGALPDLIEHGKTGFLVDSVAEMAQAIGHSESIDAECCRKVARERFSSTRMVGQYLDLYRSILSRVTESAT